MVDALGNPLAFFLTAGQAHDLQGADVLLPKMQAGTLLADKAFDVDERVIEPLLAAGKNCVIPPKSNRKVQRLYDKELYKARHLMENFYCKLMPALEWLGALAQCSEQELWQNTLP
jgi:transposase